jgi:hypothetical protein
LGCDRARHDGVQGTMFKGVDSKTWAHCLDYGLTVWINGCGRNVAGRQTHTVPSA